MSQVQTQPTETTPTENKPQEKKLLDPESCVINISMRKNVRSYVFISKLVLKKFGNLELNSLGRASQYVIRIAENLQRNNFASIDKIESKIMDLDDKNSESGTKSMISFSVKMTKTDKFDELTKDLK